MKFTITFDNNVKKPSGTISFRTVIFIFRKGRLFSFDGCHSGKYFSFDSLEEGTAAGRYI